MTPTAKWPGGLMNRLLIMALASTTLGVAKLTTEYFVDPPVNLQASTPGIAQSGHINVSGTVRAGTFYGSSGGTTTKVVSGWATSSTGFVFGGDFRTNSTDGRGVFASALATTGSNYGGDFRSASSDGRGIFGYATSTTGKGIGGDFRTDSPNGKGVIGRATGVSGFSYGVYGTSDSTTGRGVYGGANGVSGVNYGGYFETASNGGVGVYARNAASGVGLLAESSGTALQVNGFASFSNTALFSGTVGFVGSPAFTVSSATKINNLNADTLDGIDSGAFLQAVPVPLKLVGNDSSAVLDVTNNYPIVGAAAIKALNPAGTAIVANASDVGIQATAGAEGGIALYGWAAASTSGNYGVYGISTSSGGYGLYAVGNTGASGTKSFRIDHPADPENKYLLHYSTESPQPQNFYNGNVTTDGNGEAWVELPDYFGDINKDFKYTLTVVDDSDSTTFVMAKVARKIRDNRFKIRTNAPNIEVSWRVDALRNDRWVQRNGAPTVVEKSGREKGTYQNPELYDLPANRGLSHALTSRRSDRPLQK